MSVANFGLGGEGIIRAAGGVVWRAAPPGGAWPLEVLVIHRPHRQDWSLPKGKLEPGETDEQAAVREVEEETGFRCTMGVDLGLSHHVDHKGRPKTTHWWEMQVESGEFAANDEVDEVRWLIPEDAAGLLTWASDHQVLERLLAAWPQLAP